MITKNKNWFTLIELVVVITILAIIMSISFISLSSYLTKSRDSKRVIDINSVALALEIDAKKNWWIFLIPSKSIITSISSWSLTTPFSYLWIIDENTNLWFNDVPKDPVSWDYYVYWLTSNRKYYQLAATFEDTSNISSSFLLPTTYASNEFAYLYWNYKKNPDIWNTLDWLIFLEETVDNLKVLPDKDKIIWSYESDWSIKIGTGITIVENMWKDVAYNLFKKNTDRSIKNTDFYISADSISLKCPSCAE